MAFRYFIKFATRGRPEKFLQGMKNIEQSTKTDDYLIVVSVDEDDKEMVAMIPEINRMKNTAGYIGKPWGKIAAINRDVSLYIPWHILVNYSDDMVLSNGWDEIVSNNVFKTWPDTDFFYHCNDGHVGERLPTMSIMGREYYERFGYIYHPAYKSVSCDAEAFYVALTLGKHKYFPEPIVEHRHPVNVRGQFDKVYSENDKHTSYDTDLYFRRMKRNFYVNNPGNVVFEQFKR